MGRLHFVTGKGGVGKSSFALWLAKDQGLKLSELHDDLKHCKDLWALRGRSSLASHHSLSRKELYSQFISSAFHIPWIKGFLQKSDLFENLLQLAPNLFELLALQEWLRLADTEKSKALLIDAPSTGNFISLIHCVRTALDVFDGGAMRKAAESVEADFQRSVHHVSIVSLPEESSLAELREIEGSIQRAYPHWIFENCLNRLHLPVESTEGLSPRLKELAQERPLREKARSNAYIFRWTFQEGGLLP